MQLAGDVGGTKTAFALHDERDGRLVLVHEDTVPSRAAATFEDLVHRFLASGPRGHLHAACFGVAGPVVDGRVTTTNLPWELSEASLARALPADRVRLLNDLVATAEGVLALPPEALLTIQAGAPRRGTMALIAAGTGLGEAIIAVDGAGHRVLGSEGGHADFAPRGDLQIDLLRFLRRDTGHVSYERVLSGPGLVAIYRFLCQGRGGVEPEWLRERMVHDDPAAVVSEVGLAGEHPLGVEALDLFVSIYGAEAGNLALKALAVGGVYLAGGIAPKLRARFTDGRFIAAFRDKGRLGPLLASMPVHLVLEPRAALLGAIEVARTLAGTPPSGASI